MKLNVVIAGLVITILAIVLVVGAQFFILQKSREFQKNVDEKCIGTNETSECLDAELQLANNGMQYLGMVCGGGVMLVVGLIVLIYGFVAKDEKAAGPQYPPPQGPPPAPMYMAPPPPQPGPPAYAPGPPGPPPMAPPPDMPGTQPYQPQPYPQQQYPQQHPYQNQPGYPQQQYQQRPPQY